MSSLDANSKACQPAPGPGARSAILGSALIFSTSEAGTGLNFRMIEFAERNARVRGTAAKIDFLRKRPAMPNIGLLVTAGQVTTSDSSRLARSFISRSTRKKFGIV